ncbi:unnamed protein product, partial [Discosporangium mesarthrocarpum]
MAVEEEEEEAEMSLQLPSSHGTGTEPFPRLQLFDLVAGGAFERALEGLGRKGTDAGDGAGIQDEVWAYLPCFLQMLRDGSTTSGGTAGDHFDRLLKVVIQNRRADAAEDYLNVAKDCCTNLRKGLTTPLRVEPPSPQGQMGKDIGGSGWEDKGMTTPDGAATASTAHPLLEFDLLGPDKRMAAVLKELIVLIQDAEVGGA